MSMFMNVLVPVLYMAGLLLVVLFVLGLLMLMRNAIERQELTHERIAAETDLIHAFKARELIALDRDGMMLQQLGEKFVRDKDLFNTDAYSQAGYENPAQPHTDKGEPVLGPLTRQRDPEVPNPKHTNTVFQGGDQFGREVPDTRIPVHNTQWELKDKDIDESRYTPSQGPDDGELAREDELSDRR